MYFEICNYFCLISVEAPRIHIKTPKTREEINTETPKYKSKSSYKLHYI